MRLNLLHQHTLFFISVLPPPFRCFWCFYILFLCLSLCLLSLCLLVSLIQSLSFCLPHSIALPLSLSLTHLFLTTLPLLLCLRSVISLSLCHPFCASRPLCISFLTCTRLPCLSLRSRHYHNFFFSPLEKKHVLYSLPRSL